MISHAQIRIDDSYLDSTTSKLLVSHTSTIGLGSGWLHIGKFYIERIGKWKNKQREGKLLAHSGYLRLYVVRRRKNGSVQLQGQRLGGWEKLEERTCKEMNGI